jgi:hypothetical protein
MKSLIDKEIIEIQISNLLFVLSMLLSFMHFPVITSYFGTLIFIFNLSFGFYILKVNRGHINRVRGRSLNAEAA